MGRTISLPSRRISALVAVLVAGALMLALAARAAAHVAWRPCSHTPGFACARIAVALDPSGVVPGTISLEARLHRAAQPGATVAIVGLAGGPGQAAIPYAQVMAKVLGRAALSRYDLIVFDQRGTGESGALHCAALQSQPLGASSVTRAVKRCATELGTAGHFYSTADSVADIEAIRRAAGYQKLILYGTSYGTDVALAYARAYPSQVQALVLDSTVAPGGLAPFDAPTFAAIPSMLRDLCSGGACARITADPADDLAKLTARLRRASLSATVYFGRGEGIPVKVTENDVAEILLAGDEDPSLRAGFPAAVRSALDGDTAPLGSLALQTMSASAVGSAGIDATLNLATDCEDGPFPWQSAASTAVRLAQFRAALRAVPAGAFAPFDARTAEAFSTGRVCTAWPDAAGMPAAAPAALPDVPTIIFSGADDLRTPTANARAVAGEIPDAQVVVVSHVGHSTLEADSSHCATRALAAFFASKPLPDCTDASGPAFEKPTPVAPASVARLAPAAGLHGRAGRSVTAVRDTLEQVSQQTLAFVSASQAAATVSAPTRPSLPLAGLRGGWIALRVRPIGIALHGYSYVPGLRLTGSLRSGGHLTVDGPAAARGVLRVVGGRLTGRLAGVPVTIAIPGRLRKELASPAGTAARAPVGL